MAGDRVRIRFVSSLLGGGLWRAMISSVFPTTYLGVSAGVYETWTYTAFYVPTLMDVAIVGGINSITDGSSDTLISVVEADFLISGDGFGIWRSYSLRQNENIIIRETVRLIPGFYSVRTSHRASGGIYAHFLHSGIKGGSGSSGFTLMLVANRSTDPISLNYLNIPANSLGEEINADVDGDYCVDDDDLLAVLMVYGQTCNGCSEDANSDGVVDDLDLLLVLINWAFVMDV